jgi:hypothetical protein
MGKSEIGDTFEHLFKSNGSHLVEKHFNQPYHMIAGEAGTGRGGGRSSRGTPLDFRLNEKYGGELKTLNSNAKNQKTAIKAEEVARKEAAVKADGLAPMLIVQVVDMENQKINVFYHPAFSSKAVSRMQPLGSYSFTGKDFQNAQEATGHWSQRAERARRQRGVTVSG